MSVLAPTSPSLSFANSLLFPRVAQLLGVRLQGGDPLSALAAKVGERLSQSALGDQLRPRSLETLARFAENPEDPELHPFGLRRAFLELLSLQPPSRLIRVVSVPAFRSRSPWLVPQAGVEARQEVSVQELVARLREIGATDPITDVLIWNTGMSWARLAVGFRALSQRLTGDHHAIRLITVVSDDDQDSNFRGKSDWPIRIPGRTPNETYNNLERYREVLRQVVEKVRETRGPEARVAVAVGWGFIAENPAAAKIAAEEGVLFIGPSETAIADLGDKAKAKVGAGMAQVPMVPGSDGVLRDVDQVKEIAGQLGYPVVLKAKAGGGGKGIRFVETPEEMATSFEAARGEALSAFGDGSLIMEKKVVRPRHIEVQILRDRYGTCIPIGARDCSLQRKAQKEVEMSAHETVPLEILRKMKEAAVRIAHESNYVNAGTVEFLYDPASREFYFMEVNTRLQVEHPVTEEELGVDLVALQYAIASGAHLDQIFSAEERRRFSEEVPPRFTLAVRIIASDGWTGKGRMGKITQFQLPQGIPGLRMNWSVGLGSSYTGMGDRQIGHLFVTADDHRTALARMRQAIGQLWIEGINTNIDFLRHLLRSPEVERNEGVHTLFLEKEFLPRNEDKLTIQPDLHVAIIAMAIEKYRREMARLEGVVTRAAQGGGALPKVSRQQRVEILYGGRTYPFDVSGDDHNNYFLTPYLEGRALPPYQANLGGGSGSEGRLRLGDQIYSVIYEADSVSIDRGRPVAFLVTDPSRIVAEMPGKVVRILVKEGQRVRKGDEMIVVEAMKMENPIPAGSDGTIRKIHVAGGDPVEARQLLMEFEPAGLEAVTPTPPAEFPSIEAEEAHFPELAARLFSGVPILWEVVKRALDNYQQANSPGTYVETTLPFLEAFWEREGGSLEKEMPNPAVEWRRALTRSNLKDQIALIEGVLLNYRRATPADLQGDLLVRVERFLHRLMEFEALPEWRRVQLEVRRLLDHFFPAQRIDVSERLIELAHRAESDPAAAQQALQELVNYPFSMVREVAPLLSSGNFLLRELAGKLLLLRTYKTYPVEKADTDSEADLLLYRFRDRYDRSRRNGVALFAKVPEMAQRLTRAYRGLMESRGRIERQLSLPVPGDSPQILPIDRDVIEVFSVLPPGVDPERLVDEITSILNGVIPKDFPKRVTFTVAREDGYPLIRTFRPQGDGTWRVDPLRHDLHPIDAESLELSRYEAFNLEKLPSTHPHIHLFRARARTVEGDERLTARATIPFARVDYITVPALPEPVLSSTVPALPQPVLPDVEDLFAQALESLIRASLGQDPGGQLTNNNIMLHVEMPLTIPYEGIDGAVRHAAARHRASDYDLAGLRTVELVFYVQDPEDKEGRGFKKVIASVSNPTGTELVIKIFVVARREGGNEVLVPLSEFLKKRKDPSYEIPASRTRQVTSYRPLGKIDFLREKERARGALYVYDRVEALREGLQEIWAHHGGEMPEDAFVAREFVLKNNEDHQEGVEFVGREAGENKLSYVAWEVRVKYPEGKERRFVFGSNDQTVANGTMDLPDDRIYAGAAYRAIGERIPFISVFAGGGARMVPNVAVAEATVYEPVQNDLYLTREKKEELGDQVLTIEEVHAGETLFKVTGVRATNQSSLRGSGLMIAASIDVSEAVPTLGIAGGDVVVGKQTYAYRELHSTIQTERTAVLLTGLEAINRGLGGDYYRSNRQIGGPDIHASSGVTHAVVTDEKAALRRALEWVRYLPEPSPPAVDDRGALIHVAERIHPLPSRLWEESPPGLKQDWDVEAVLLGGDQPVIRLDQEGNPQPYDVRLLAGAIFDHKSFRETNPIFAPNVVTGYATLGGRPVGVILFDAEKRTTTLPPDPAREASEALRTRQWTPRVWDPWGSSKTADFFFEVERLSIPLVIMPNIRGFLGDTTALLNEVIKHGARIARQLRHRKFRTVAWLPPYAELRGGAHVVIDPNINPGQMVFLLDPHSILGVLEPEMMLGLPKVVRILERETTRLGSADQARKKVLRLLRLADVATIANQMGGLHGVVPTRHARRALYAAAFETW